MSKIIKPEQLNQKSIEKLLQDYFNDPKLEVVDVLNRNQNFLAENDNFNSEIKKWEVRIKRSTGETFEEVEISFIVKSSPDTVFTKRLSSMSRPFLKEVFWFNHAFPALKQLCPEIAYISPDCYYAYSTYEKSMMGTKMFMEKVCCFPCFPLVLPEEVGLLLLQNLSSGDNPFKVLDKHKVVTYPQAKVIFETMARFHGSWLKWRLTAATASGDNLGTLRLKHLKQFKVRIPSWMIKNMLGHTWKTVMCLLQHQKVDQEIITRYEAYTKTVASQRINEISNPKTEMAKSKIVTVCHGDLWSNNIMFSQDESKNILIDFQMLTLAHPSLDLWYFLIINSDKAFRNAHLDDLLKNYFEVFDEYLNAVNIEMTFEEFSNEFYERRDYMFSFGILTMPNVLSPNQINLDGWDAISKMNQKRAQEIGGEPSPDDHPIITEIRRRLVDVVLEAAEEKLF